MGNIENILNMYSDVPRSVVLRYELNRIGVASSADALAAVQNEDLCFKGEFMFSWDSTERKSLNQRVPWAFHFKRDDTIFINRTNDNSPYVIDVKDGRFYLTENGVPFEEVYFSHAPAYYHKKTSDCVPMSQIAQSLGDMLFVTLNKYCEYFKRGEQCLFCDLTPTGVDQHQKGEAASMHRSTQQVVETLNEALSEFVPRSHRHLIFSGGAILTKLSGMDEVEYYSDCVEKIIAGVHRWFPAGIQIEPPPTRDGWKRLKDTGIASIQPNLEVMDKQKFEVFCPGKAKSVGYDEWIRRMFVGAEVFGPGKIIPNFVIGCEMAKPYGFTDVDEAVAASIKGFEHLMQNGVFPRLAIWLREAKSRLAEQEPAPLEYYIKLGKAYTTLRRKYGFDDVICGCRGCWVQDSLYDWDYADKQAGVALR